MQSGGECSLHERVHKIVLQCCGYRDGKLRDGKQLAMTRKASMDRQLTEGNTGVKHFAYISSVSAFLSIV
jgi:hypothetical protein